MRVLAEDTGNPQVLPSFLETDSKAFILTALDFSGKALAFRNERRQLVFIISCVQVNLIKLNLVTTTLMTSDSMAKDYRPLNHRSTSSIIGNAADDSKSMDLCSLNLGIKMILY